MSSIVRFAAALAFAAPVIAQTTPTRAPVTSAPAAQKPWNPAEILRTETWVKPPAVIERIVMTPRVDISFTSPSPDRKWFLRATGDDRGDIVAYGKAHLNLGGVQIDTQANRARSVTTSTRRGLMLIDPRTNTTRTITTPAKASISAPVWSPTGTHIAYIANFVGASHVYVADATTGVSTQVTTTPLLATFVTTVDWTADGKSVIAVVVPAGRGPAPTHGKGGVEEGPWVRVNDGRPNQQVVHFDLLEDPHDKAQLKYYTTGQLVVINVATKVARKVGAPGMIRSVDAAPDGQAFRVTTMLEPFSYAVPVSSFGSKQELWDATGKAVATFSFAPYREGGRGGRGGGAAAAADSTAQGTPAITTRQGLAWNPVGPGLVFTERAGGAAAAGGGRAGGGGGNAGGNVRYMNWLPPYGPNDTKLIYEGSPQLGAIMYSADAKTMFVTDSGALIAFRLAEPSKRFRLPNGLTVGGGGGGGGRGGAGGGGRGAVAPGADPAPPGAPADTSAASASGGGPLLTKNGRNGQPMVIVASDGKTVYLRGNRTPGARWQTEAPRQWLDKVNFESGARARVFDAAADAFEEFVTPLDDDFTQYLYTRETPTVIGDAFIRDTKTGASRQITKNKDTAPEVTRAQKKRLQITRPDSIKFWVDVTLPVDWQPGAKMPGVVWFYPREYSTQAAYDQSKYSTNINAFPEVPSARPATATKIWVTQGYVFIEPDCPIIGPVGRMNDNYTKDLQLNLKLVVDAVVAAGYVDRDRIGLGGHSYGAFSTMNALSLVGNTLFRAGIAGDGMYNRSLTPFGFQSERRTFYDAQSTYLDMSPFFRADKFQVPVLLYHSLEDQNAGTDPISSTRMYHALNGLGKTAALYMYPYEDHSVATYTSDLDMWARWIAWFDTHVKPPPAAPRSTSGG